MRAILSLMTTLRKQFNRYWHLGLIVTLWIFHALSNWLWLTANARPAGSDRPSHLLKTLTYNDILQPVTVKTLFQAWTCDSYRPPLLYISAIPLYRLFGVSWDVASMANVLYMGILLFSIYGIGRRMCGKQVGLLSAVLTSLLPIIFAMSRYFYLDFALTAMVALAICCLLYSDEFSNRRYSLLFGLSLGLGMLIKWTLAGFVFVPLVLVVAKSPLVHEAAQEIKRLSIDWRSFLFSTVIGLLLTCLWYLPNATAVEELVLGRWLFVISWLLLAATFYIPMRSSARTANLVGALLLGASVASTWYLTRIDFLGRFSEVAYGGGEASDPFTPFALAYYPVHLTTGELSLPLSAVFLLAVIRLASPSAANGGLLKRLRGAGVDSWVLISWFLAPFIVFTLSTHRDPRTIMPVVPVAAIAIACGLFKLRDRRVRIAAVCLTLLFGLIQFFVLSCDVFAKVPAQLSVNVARFGPIGFFAQGRYTEWPNSGINDERYWVMPQVLEVIQENSAGDERPVLGLLVHNNNINDKNTLYLIATEYPEIELREIGRLRKWIPAYPQIFSCDYIVLHRNITDATQRALEDVVESLVNSPPPSFTEAFQLVRTYPWPDGDVVYLYRHIGHSIPNHFPDDMLYPIQHVKQVNFDKILFLGYDLDDGKVGSGGKVKVSLYWLCLRPMEEDYLVYLKLVNSVYHIWGERDGRPYWTGLPTNVWTQGQVIKDEWELEILPGTPPGEYQVEITLYDPYISQPLGTKDGSGLLLGPVWVSKGRRPAIEKLDIEHQLDANLSDQVRLLGYKIESGFRPGDGIHLTLFWQALKTMDKDYTVFTHLVDGEGHIWGQKDNPPVDGFYPTTAWEAGEIVRDQYDLKISPDAPPGPYQIEVGMYLAETGERLTVIGEKGTPLGDKMVLQPVSIGGGQ